MNEDTFCIFMCAGIHEQQWNTKECENSNSDRHSSKLAGCEIKSRSGLHGMRLMTSTHLVTFSLLISCHIIEHRVALYHMV